MKNRTNLKLEGGGGLPVATEFMSKKASSMFG